MDCSSSLSLVGVLMLSAAYLLLLARILARGNAGISTTSQLLHSFAFFFLYTGLWTGQTPREHRGIISDWLWLKVYLMPFSVLILVAMRFRKAGAESKQRVLSLVKESSTYTILSLLLAYRINYGSFSWTASLSPTSNHSWLSIVAQYFSLEDLLTINARDAGEALWAASIFLAAVADIPQYVAYYRHTTQKIDGLLIVMAIMALAPSFNIPLWVGQYMETRSLNYIALIGAILQALAFWIFFVLVVTKVNDRDSDLLEDLEAQLEEYDTRRWGREGVAPQLSRHAGGEETKLSDGI